jgi:hypothetical protein
MTVDGAIASEVLKLDALAKFVKGYWQRALRRGDQRLAIAAANREVALENRILGIASPTPYAQS